MPRTCEENLANRAWASASHRRRLAEQLLTEPTIQKVHGRLLRAALQAGHPQAIAEALPALQAEVARCQGLSHCAGRPLRQVA